MMDEPEYFYRISDITYAPMLDEFESPLGGSRPDIVCGTHRVLKRTAKGVWLDNYGERKFVLSSAVKRWALPTKAEAVESYLARKDRQISIMQARIRSARERIEIAKAAETKLWRSNP